MTELKPCPCCQNPALLIKGGANNEVRTYKVECHACGMRSPSSTDERIAVGAWNYRAAPPIGTRYRNTDNEVVAVVAPAKASSKGLGFWGGGALYKADTSQGMAALSEHVFDFMLAALPEPE